MMKAHVLHTVVYIFFEISFEYSGKNRDAITCFLCGQINKSKLAKNLYLEKLKGCICNIFVSITGHNYWESWYSLVLNIYFVVV